MRLDDLLLLLTRCQCMALRRVQHLLLLCHLLHLMYLMHLLNMIGHLLVTLVQLICLRMSWVVVAHIDLFPVSTFSILRLRCKYMPWLPLEAMRWVDLRAGSVHETRRIISLQYALKSLYEPAINRLVIGQLYLVDCHLWALVSCLTILLLLRSGGILGQRARLVMLALNDRSWPSYQSHIDIITNPAYLTLIVNVVRKLVPRRPSWISTLISQLFLWMLGDRALFVEHLLAIPCAFLLIKSILLIFVGPLVHHLCGTLEVGGCLLGIDQAPILELLLLLRLYSGSLGLALNVVILFDKLAAVFFVAKSHTSILVRQSIEKISNSFIVLHVIRELTVGEQVL